MNICVTCGMTKEKNDKVLFEIKEFNFINIFFVLVALFLFFLSWNLYDLNPNLFNVLIGIGVFFLFGVMQNTISVTNKYLVSSSRGMIPIINNRITKYYYSDIRGVKFDTQKSDPIAGALGTMLEGPVSGFFSSYWIILEMNDGQYVQIESEGDEADTRKVVRMVKERLG